MATYEYTCDETGYSSTAAATWGWNGGSDIYIKSRDSLHVGACGFHATSDRINTGNYWFSSATINLGNKNNFNTASVWHCGISTQRVDSNGAGTTGLSNLESLNKICTTKQRINNFSLPNSVAYNTSEVNILPIIARSHYNFASNTLWFSITATETVNNGTIFYGANNNVYPRIKMVTTSVGSPTITWPHSATSTSNRKTTYNSKPYVKIVPPTHPYKSITTTSNGSTKFSWTKTQVKVDDGSWTDISLNSDHIGRLPSALSSGNHTLKFRCVDSTSRVTGTATAYIKYVVPNTVSKDSVITRAQMNTLATYIENALDYYGISGSVTVPTQYNSIARSDIASNYTTQLNKVGSQGGKGASFGLSAPT